MKSENKSVDFSVIITAHHEGLLAHKTILGILEAVALLEKEGVSYEIIVSMDNPDKVTEEYYERYHGDSRFKVVKVSYGNVSDSRNNAIRLSKGKYVALIDGDDLISPNFYKEAYMMAKTRSGLFALRPNIQLQFSVEDGENGVWVLGDSFTKEKDALIMAQFNRWPSVAAVFSREIFDTISFLPATKGYGYEDYHFNAEMVAAGIPQIVVPQTTFFYRRKRDGKQNEHISEHTILPRTKLLDFNFIQSIDAGQQGAHSETNSKVRLSQRVRPIAANAARASVRYGKKITPVRIKTFAKPIVRRFITRVYNDRLPDWFIQQWKAMNHIENQLWPTAASLANLDYHLLSFDQDGAQAVKIGGIYHKLVQQFTKNPDYIFFTYNPLGAGGTEKVLMHYINAIKKIHPNYHFAVFRKKPSEFPFDVPEGVDFIDFYGATKGLHEWEQDILMDRLIIQAGAKHLNFFFSGWAGGDDAYRWVREHSKLLIENKYIVNIFWFMREVVIEDEKERIVTFADPYLREIYSSVSRVFTDNQTIIDESLANNAFDVSKFSVHYQPIDTQVLVPPKTIDPKKPLRILWGGRLAYQKRPDILRKIAEKLDPNDFHIDIYGREQEYKGKYFNGIRAATYKREFSGFDDLPVKDYDVFLYTSQVDGLPNTLLEATAAGLPIVASGDGGVGEFIIDGKTGRLVDPEDIDGYIRALQQMRKNPKLASEFVYAAQKLLKTRHTLEQFEEDVKRDDF